jgi:hypothetical protein
VVPVAAAAAAADDVAIERMSEEYSGLPMERDGMEDDEDEGTVGAACLSSSRSESCTWVATAGAEVLDDNPTSISPLSQPMNTAICTTTSIEESRSAARSSCPFMGCNATQQNIGVIARRTFVPASCYNIDRQCRNFSNQSSEVA